jgi:hypothetical protein
MKGPENETRAVDKKEMITVFHGEMDSAARRKDPLRG